MNDGRKANVRVVRYPQGDAEADRAVACIAAQLGVSEITAKILWNRGHRTVDACRAFLFSDGQEMLHDPFLMRDMDRAVARIRTGIEHAEKMVIYGDYDVDGVTSVSALYLYLTEKGADISYYIPSRTKEGYGLSESALAALAADGVKLVITVDTGITAVAECAYAKSLGMEMVITDHHECREELPDACAVVNPHRQDCTYPFTELAGVGVVFKLLCAYESALRTSAFCVDADAVESVFAAFGDLVAIGTVADVMPMVDENRQIVSRGLQLIANTRRCGLQALMDAALSGQTAAREKRTVNASFIGYTVAPRINAAGRIDHAGKAVELLLCQDAEKAEALALELCAINRQRQTEENAIAEAAYRMIENEDPTDRYVIVLENDNWHQGVIGIVASRITERYGVPSIMITFDGATRGYASPDDIGKGSGRSVKGINLVEALQDASSLLLRYGGHELAAGLSISRDQIPAFRAHINAYAKERLHGEMPCRHSEVDCTVKTGELTMKLAQELSALEPFGTANETPTFLLQNATVSRIVALAGGKHTKLLLTADGITHTAVWFGMAPANLEFAQGDPIDAVFTLHVNEFRGQQTLQLLLSDASLTGKCSADRAAEEEALYQKICQGARFSTEDAVVPTREDFALIYKLMRAEGKLGHSVISERVLLSHLHAHATHPVNRIRVRFVLRILHEMQLCKIRDMNNGIYMFEMIGQSGGKINLEDSVILQTLRRQCIDGEG